MLEDQDDVKIYFSLEVREYTYEELSYMNELSDKHIFYVIVTYIN